MGRGKTSDFLSLEEVGRLAGGASRANESLSRLSVFNAWSRAVGPTLRAVTRPARIAKKRLVIEVGGASWQRELERLRPEILDRLGVLLPAGSVTSLAFNLRPGLPQAGGKVPCDGIGEPRQDRPAASGAGLAEPAAPTSRESAVGDGDLRRRFAEVARRHLRARA